MRDACNILLWTAFWIMKLPFGATQGDLKWHKKEDYVFLLTFIVAVALSFTVSKI